MDSPRQGVRRRILSLGEDAPFQLAVHSVSLGNTTAEWRSLYQDPSELDVKVCALTPHQEIVLVRMFRLPIEDFSVELPGGGVEPEETPAQAATRELLEETGYAPSGPVQELNVFWRWPGKANVRTITFVATNCTKVQDPQLDPMETRNDLTVQIMRIKEVLNELAEGNREYSTSISHAILTLAGQDILKLSDL